MFLSIPLLGSAALCAMVWRKVMTAKSRFSAFLRGYCSVLDLHPTAARKAYRDSIVDAQANGLYDIWSQVGDQLREAQGEFSRKETTQQGEQEVRVNSRSEARHR
jgi:hypothetical protein